MTDMVDVVFAIARTNASAGGQVLGTAFGVTPKLLATCLHNIGGSDSDLVMIAPSISSIDDYQETTPASLQVFPLKLKTVDALRDICLLEVGDPSTSIGHFVKHGSTDSVKVGDSVSVYGYPHADAARVVLTRHDAIVGAKVLLDAEGVAVKHIVVNTLARPGQSGAPVVSGDSKQLLGVLIGSFAPRLPGIEIENINPQALHQTTHVVSAEYVARMIPRV